MLNELSLRVPRLTAVYAVGSSRPLGTRGNMRSDFSPHDFIFDLPTGRGRGDCVRCFATRMSGCTLDFQARSIPSNPGAAERSSDGRGGCYEIGLAENQSSKFLVVLRVGARGKNRTFNSQRRAVKIVP